MACANSCQVTRSIKGYPRRRKSGLNKCLLVLTILGSWLPGSVHSHFDRLSVRGYLHGTRGHCYRQCEALSWNQKRIWRNLLDCLFHPRRSFLVFGVPLKERGYSFKWSTWWQAHLKSFIVSVANLRSPRTFFSQPHINPKPTDRVLNPFNILCSPAHPAPPLRPQKTCYG